MGASRQEADGSASIRQLVQNREPPYPKRSWEEAFALAGLVAAACESSRTTLKSPVGALPGAQAAGRAERSQMITEMTSSVRAVLEWRKLWHTLKYRDDRTGSPES
jgi:hypothetical protein